MIKKSGNIKMEKYWRWQGEIYFINKTRSRDNNISHADHIIYAVIYHDRIRIRWCREHQVISAPSKTNNCVTICHQHSFLCFSHIYQIFRKDSFTVFRHNFLPVAGMSDFIFCEHYDDYHFKYFVFFHLSVFISV